MDENADFSARKVHEDVPAPEKKGFGREAHCTKRTGNALNRNGTMRFNARFEKGEVVSSGQAKGKGGKRKAQTA